MAVLVSKLNFARPSESLKSVFISPIPINVGNIVINVLFKDKILRRERFYLFREHDSITIIFFKKERVVNCVFNLKIKTYVYNKFLFLFV